ncbi:expression site-associated gene (ESAG) protein, putative [Trypanosoma equiperdum]|uniref:Expression site-associated gene 1 (ESAG1) protein, putative n=1 Tax=Trypanosoma equiperdum TaxID=5694 RepID=A0A1G4IEU7_TRYEQ|nr:expression site-associated gene (ESAG) protein, putative [Trypanosoma equiperdum]
MKVTIAELVVLLFSVICIDGKEDNGCTLITDYHGDAPLSESVCYLSCLSDALNNLYSDGEKRLFMNEEVYANAFRILDDMEGRAGESVRYLSIISVAMVEENNRLEKLISHGNAMGDLVAKAGGLFAEVNESVRAVRKEIPGALIKVNKYYTAIAEVTRTVWDDIKGVGLVNAKFECKDPVFESVGEYQATCPDYRCPFNDGVNVDAFQKYKNECLEITVSYFDKCRAQKLPRDILYGNGIVVDSRSFLEWRDNGHNYFQLILKIRQIFVPLIGPFAAGQPPPVILEIMSNITSLYSHFNRVHEIFTSFLRGTNLTDSANISNSAI